MARSHLGVAILSYATLGCGSEQATNTLHPTRQALEHLEAEATVAIGSDTVAPAVMNKQTASRWHMTRRGILDARPGPVLGTLDDDDDGTSSFGANVAVALGHDGLTHVLDAQNGRVIEFDVLGRVVSEFGRIGDGPMEFRTPRDIDRRGDSLFITQDGGVKVFHRSRGEYMPMDFIRAQAPLQTICLLDGTFFAGVLRQPDAPLARYDLHVPRAARGFGRSLESGPDPVRARLSTGPTACAHDSDRVVHGQQYLPTLVAYTPHGEEAWAAFLSDYVQGRWTYTADGWLETPLGPMESLTNLAVTPSGFVVASYFRVDESANRSSRVYLIDAKTGQGGLLEETNERDREIMAIAEDRYVTYVIGPYPRLRLWYMDNPK